MKEYKPAGNVKTGAFSKDNPRNFDNCYNHRKVNPSKPKEGHLVQSGKRYT